jgi:hypothetical protein
MANTANTRRRALVAVIPLLLALAVPTIVTFKIKAREDTLHRRGRLIDAVVVAVDDRGATDYLWVRYTGCACPAAVATSNPAAHPVGTAIVVRYDPEHLRRAEALVDAPNPYEPVLPIWGGVALGIVIIVPVVAATSRRSRRARALVATTAPVARVRVEAWERSQLNQVVPYLSVYPADVPPGGPPLVAVPVPAEAIDGIHAGDVFDLFGSTQPGEPLALRRDDLVLVPAGKSKDAAWEARHRQPQDGLSAALDAAPAAPAAPAFAAARGPRETDTDVGTFADPREARRYRSLNTQFVWLFALFLPMSLLRAAPERFAWLIVVVALGFVVALMTVLWRQRRLLSSIAARLPGPAPATRASRAAAHRAAQRRIASPAGQAELAELLGTTPEGLRSRARRLGPILYTSFAITGVAFALLLVQLVTT